MTPAFRQAMKSQKFKTIPYHTKEKPMIVTSITIFLWLITALHTELNWQVIILWIVAVFLTIRYWSWKVALLLLVLSFGSQNELLWIKYSSIGAFAIVLFFTSVFSSYVASFTSFSTPSKVSQDDEEEKAESESDLWTE